MISKKLKPPAHGNGPIRLAIVLPGLGRVRRGAETAFGELAVRLARQPAIGVMARAWLKPQGLPPERAGRWPGVLAGLWLIVRADESWAGGTHGGVGVHPVCGGGEGGIVQAGV